MVLELCVIVCLQLQSICMLLTYQCCLWLGSLVQMSCCYIIVYTVTSLPCLLQDDADLLFHRWTPDPIAASTKDGSNGSALYFYDRFYDNVHVERQGVTALTWPKPKLKFQIAKKV